MIDKILQWDNLCRAWKQAQANKGAPGVDEVTLTRWGRNWETNLHRLREQVQTNTYHPNRPRRFRVAKPDGGFRELSILTVTDRVLQRAALNVLEPLWEQRFLNCSFGYRPNRGVANAVTTVVRERERGKRWVLDADIERCFESLDHGVIRELLWPEVTDGRVRRLFDLWLGVGSRSQHPKLGVPLGAVVSPLLCNVVLHELDAALTRAGWTVVRYADDFVVLTETEGQALTAWEEAEYALDGLKLKVNPEKTRVASFEGGFKFLGVQFKGDEYAYVHEQKRIRVKGPTVKMLHTYRPEFY